MMGNGGYGHSRPNPPARVLVIGGTGMLGRAWHALLAEQGRETLLVRREQLDLTRPATIQEWVNGRCPLVVNCAARSNVDLAESDYEATLQVNGYGVGELARRCGDCGVTLLHYSTDHVFDGTRSSPYPVGHPHAPVNAYGRSKSTGERLIRESGCRHLIVRTSWLYAPWGQNFVRVIANLAKERPWVTVVDDQYGRPTSAAHLAAASLRLFESGAEGTWHITDGGMGSRYEWAKEVVRLTARPCEIRPCRTEDYPRPARRPRYSVLDLTETERLLGPMADWRTNLAMVMGAMEDLRD